MLFHKCSTIFGGIITKFGTGGGVVVSYSQTQFTRISAPFSLTSNLAGSTAQPPTVVCKNGSSVGIRTHCIHVFARLATIFMLSRCMFDKISASELSRKFTKSALLAGPTHPVPPSLSASLSPQCATSPCPRPPWSPAPVASPASSSRRPRCTARPSAGTASRPGPARGWSSSSTGSSGWAGSTRRTTGTLNGVTGSTKVSQSQRKVSWLKYVGKRVCVHFCPTKL